MYYIVDECKPWDIETKPTTAGLIGFLDYAFIVTKKRTKSFAVVSGCSICCAAQELLPSQLTEKLRATSQKTIGNVLKNHGQRFPKRWATFFKTTGNVFANNGQRFWERK